MAYTNIDDPSAYFHTQLYTSDSGNTQSITNNANAGNFKPDFIWAKSRADIGGYEISHDLVDSSRGRAASLHSDTAGAETTASQTNYDLISFDTNGFTTGAPENTNSLGGGAVGKVAWQWKANGGTTASNTDGSITSTVQANQDAGFSIVTYTTAGSTATIGHGLGAKPDVILLKKRNGAISWYVRHVSTGTSYLNLNLTSAAAANPTATWTTTEPTTSVYSIGTSTDFNISGGEYVAYAFAEKQGYSKFGKYVGNGDVNGTFVYTGFKPAFVMIKNASATESWVIYDTKRNSYNPTDLKLSPDTADSENNNSAIGGAAYNNIDILSNGFKCVKNNAATNGSGNTLIYMAFAENPFVTSTGIPTTAR